MTEPQGSKQSGTTNPSPRHWKSCLFSPSCWQPPSWPVHQMNHCRCPRFPLTPHHCCQTHSQALWNNNSKLSAAPTSTDCRGGNQTRVRYLAPFASVKSVSLKMLFWLLFSIMFWVRGSKTSDYASEWCNAVEPRTEFTLTTWHCQYRQLESHKYARSLLLRA